MDMNVSQRSWLFLLPQLPAKPAYLRVKLQRRIQKVGAVQVKSGVYALPFSDEATEASEWLRAELARDKGELIVLAAVLCAGLTDDELSARFEPATSPAPASVWVTRADVFVDRIASAWLIKRFIDPKATFRFVDPRQAARRLEGELRFDMQPAEFTHVGDRCTFEVLLDQFGLDDPALGAIAEVVHDIDYQDEKFGRPETAGVLMMLRGIRESEPDDEPRLERGAALLDVLYAQFTRSQNVTPGAARS